MDAKSWRVRLSLAEWRRHSHSNTYRYRDSNDNSHCDGNSHCDSNSHCDGNSDRDSDTDTWTEDYTVAKAASYAAAASLRRLILGSTAGCPMLSARPAVAPCPQPSTAR